MEPTAHNPIAAPRRASLGVCSWSLKAASSSDLARKVQQCGVDAVQLALGPLSCAASVRGALPDGSLLRGLFPGGTAWEPQRTLDVLAGAGIRVRSGMIGMRGENYTSPATIRDTGGVRHDAYWDENLRAATRSALLAWRLRLPLVSFHGGFLPHERADPLRAVMLARLRAIIDVFADHGVSVALETGQERADTLLDVLAELDRPTAGVNFDPANMLLYGMGDPVAALSALAPHVRQIHVKDARAPRAADAAARASGDASGAGAWGEEVPVGSGDVNWPAFFGVLARTGLDCDLMIEREAGDDRIGDIRRAAELVRAQLGARIAS